MWEKQLAAAIKAGELAKRAILEIYKTPFKVELKKDKSPVTTADKKADKIISEYLKQAYPKYAILTEESKDDKSRLTNDFVWIVDPLDGTTNFVDKNNEFTINIALVHKHKVVVGVVIIPITNEIYYATDHGGAFYSINGKIKEIHVSRNTESIRVLLSRLHHGKKEEEVLKKYGRKIIDKKYVGAAIKACLIAKGDAELSIGLNDKTKEWDTAASQIILKEANGLFIEPHGKWLTYNREDTTNKNGYVMANKRKNILF
ncbi:MAG: 3'(2'),5'-bisphosphate nucleotidase CysQ [Bacilli bacterium]|nr:3'(2'),5'-bisphosphate nucleotidase CysQ [Bacilli bacterium]